MVMTTAQSSLRIKFTFNIVGYSFHYSSIETVEVTLQVAGSNGRLALLYACNRASKANDDEGAKSSLTISVTTVGLGYRVF